MTTFETSKALQEAGFPQPAPAFGQTWYSTSGVRFLVYAVNGDQADIISESGQTWIGRYLNDGGMVYAPTADEILKELKSFRYCLWHNGTMGPWFVDTPDEPLFADSAAEVAACAYFKANTKIENKCYKTGNLCECSGLCRESY